MEPYVSESGPKALCVGSKPNFAVQMLETEFSRKITNRPPALAPVPERQPIGDSFFPLADGSMGHIKPRKKRNLEELEPLFTDEGERIEKKTAEEEDEELESVDIVSRLWSF